MDLAVRFAAACIVVLAVGFTVVVALNPANRGTIPLSWAVLEAIALLLLGLLARLRAWLVRSGRTAIVHDDGSSLDALTRLPDGGSFAEATAEALRRCRRAGSDTVSVFLLSLDDFKSVNERYGYRAGDGLLVASAKRLRSVVRENDFAARTGGDEFALLIAHPRDDGAIAREVGERIVRAFEEPLLVDGTVHLIGASVGVATGDAARPTVEALLRDAAFAMHRAKDEGRSRLVAFDEELKRAGCERSELASELRDALGREDGPTVAFQPIVDLDDGRCCGFMALVRWEHPVRGELSAKLLLDVARDAQLLAPLGRRVMREVCRNLAGWRDDGVLLDQLSIHVSISAAEAAHVDGCDAIETVLRSYAIPPRTLVLELRESALARDRMTAIFAARLEAFGVRVCIDEFGTGYSSLRRLNQFRVDTLKIDRSFVVSAQDDPERRSLVRGIVGLAHELGVDVIAEGIETEEEREFVRHLGCRYAQGSLLGQPLQANEARDLAYRATRRT